MTNIFVLVLLALAPSHLTLPATFSVADDLRDQMEAMLERSPTFRKQCERLGAERVYVRVRHDVCLIDKPIRARTEIQRTQAGPIVASITIGPLGNAVEWLSHEIEHVIEQVEGVRLGDMASKDRGRAWVSVPGAYETGRAIRLGRLVAAEMREAPRVAERQTRAPGDAASRGGD